jgi:SAM-dependent methyltransferase
MDQKARWNKTAGNAWVDSQAMMDRLLGPLVAPLVDGIGGRVLDVGCGTGQTTLAAVEQGAQAVGIDISTPMIEAARVRTDAAEFVVADAQTHPFAPASFDLVISRFGVMFFDDAVAAFANLAHAGRALRVIVWRTAEENSFMTTAERAAKPLLPDLPPRDPDGPGQFALGDADKVRAILTQAGWSDVDLQPLDAECTLPVSELEGYLTRLGPVGMALSDVDDTTKARVVEVLRPAFAPYVHGDDVRFTAACWLITANSENR